MIMFILKFVFMFIFHKHKNGLGPGQGDGDRDRTQTTTQKFKDPDVGYRKTFILIISDKWSDFTPPPPQSDIGGSAVRLSPIECIIDIRLSAH
jgi:hypothetical protein